MTTKVNNVTINDFIKRGVYIPRYQAASIEWKRQNRKKTETKYDAVLPFSLDLIHLYEIAPDRFFKKNQLIYTDCVCSVDFSKDLYTYADRESKFVSTQKKKIITYKKIKDQKTKSADDLRTQFYQDGFVLFSDDISPEVQVDSNKLIKFVQYKRSSSKSRLGSCLFIAEDLFQKMINWSRIDIDFPSGVEVPLADLKSYESLPLSSIEQLINVNNRHNNTIYKTIFNLEPKNILCVKDVAWSVTYPASVTTLDDNYNPKVSNIDNYMSKHDIHDGMGLLDYSLIDDTPFKDKCMFLLRERFLKCAAFATDIQKFYQDKCCEEGKDYELATTLDMFGRQYYLKDIKLIITPNSLKLLKYDLAKFVKDEDYIFNDNLSEVLNIQCRAFNYWLKHLDLFGVVKHEHASKWNDYQQATYQYLNSLPLTMDNVKELLQQELQYIDKLKNNVTVFRRHAKCYHVSKNRSFIFNLLAIDSRVENTALFKDWRRAVIKDYIQELNTGKIKIFGDYCTLISSPYELLCLSYGLDISKPIIQLNSDIPKGCLEVYTPRYSEGEELSIFRSPNINQGNVIWASNRKHDQYKYFHLNNNILIISGATCFCEQASGADEDSDFAMVSNDSILINATKQLIQSDKFYIPINGIVIPKAKRLNTPAENADIDNIINASNADIGIICNWAALLNSLYWDLESKNYQQNILSQIYDKSSMCSSLSQLAIDRSKKFYTNEQVDIQKCLRTIKRDLVDMSGNSLIKTVSIKLRKNNITDVDDETRKKVEESLAQYRARQITTTELDSILDTLLVIVNHKKNGDKKELVIQKPERPYFFNYLETGDKKQCVEKEHAWKCPMDYLCILLDNIDRRDYTPTIPLSDIWKLENKNNADRKQLDIIFRLCRNYINEKNQLWQPMVGDYKEIKEKEEELQYSYP